MGQITFFWDPFSGRRRVAYTRQVQVARASRPSSRQPRRTPSRQTNPPPRHPNLASPAEPLLASPEGEGLDVEGEVQGLRGEWRSRHGGETGSLSSLETMESRNQSSLDIAETWIPPPPPYDGTTAPPTQNDSALPPYDTIATPQTHENEDPLPPPPSYPSTTSHLARPTITTDHRSARLAKTPRHSTRRKTPKKTIQGRIGCVVM